MSECNHEWELRCSGCGETVTLVDAVCKACGQIYRHARPTVQEIDDPGDLVVDAIQLARAFVGMWTKAGVPADVRGRFDAQLEQPERCMAVLDQALADICGCICSACNAPYSVETGCDCQGEELAAPVDPAVDPLLVVDGQIMRFSDLQAANPDGVGVEWSTLLMLKPGESLDLGGGAFATFNVRRLK